MVTLPVTILYSRRYATLSQNRIRPNTGQTGGTLLTITFTGLDYCLRQSGLPQPSKDDLSQFSSVFAERHANLIRGLSNQVPFLYNRLRNFTSVPFNPIRDIPFQLVQ